MTVTPRDIAELMRESITLGTRQAARRLSAEFAQVDWSISPVEDEHNDNEFQAPESQPVNFVWDVGHRKFVVTVEDITILRSKNALANEYLDHNDGFVQRAQVVFGTDLARGNPAEFKAGYSPTNAALASIELFADVPGAYGNDDREALAEIIQSELAAERC